MQFKRSVAGAVLIGAAAFSGSALAGATANVGAFSDYMFRGISQSADPAVQGGLDYATDFGLYVGTWASNISFGGGTEQDIYLGYAGKAGDIGFDVGSIYYWYPEEDEVSAELSTVEFYAGLSFGPVGVKYYYSDEANFFIGDGDAEAAGYLLGTLALPLSETLNFTASIGFYSGDEIERVLVTEDSYMDYSIGLAKTIDGGFTATFQYVMNDIDKDTSFGFDDEPKFVVGLKKSFDL